MVATQEQTETRAIGDIVFREDLYPRFKPNQERIERYAESLEFLPPIEINQHNELIDGFHRWSAHKLAGMEGVPVTVSMTSGDDDVLRLAILRNAIHGDQLSMREKAALAQRLYRTRAERDVDALADLFSVGRRSIERWLADLVRHETEARKAAVRELWLNCYTDEQIGARFLATQQAANKWTQDLQNLANWRDFVNLAQFSETDANGKPSFVPAIDDIWYWAKSNDDTEHFGKTNSEIVDRLLWLYTEPFDIVVDPFAGSGSTGAVANQRLRRAWMGDRQPKPGSSHIRKHDIAEGPPDYLRWADVSLVYLDPPYWRQAECKYSDSDADLANMDLETFNSTLTTYIRKTAEKLKSGAHVALIIQPTMWNAPERQVVDHVIDIIGLIGKGRLAYERRFSCPYPTQQHLPQMVQWAKDHRSPLVRNRELIIWRRGA